MFAYLARHYSMADLDAMGFWLDVDSEIDAQGTCVVPLPLGSN